MANEKTAEHPERFTSEEGLPDASPRTGRMSTDDLARLPTGTFAEDGVDPERPRSPLGSAAQVVFRRRSSRPGDDCNDE